MPGYRAPMVPGTQVLRYLKNTNFPGYPGTHGTGTWYLGTPRYLASEHFNTSRGQEFPTVTGTMVPEYVKKNKGTSRYLPEFPDA